MIAAVALIASLGAAQIPSAPVQLSAPSGGIGISAANTLYLRLDGANWNAITGLVWVMALGGTPGGYSLTLTNAGSTTLGPFLRVRQSATSGANGEDANIDVMNSSTIGDTAAELRLLNGTLSEQMMLRLQTGIVNWAACSGNPEACGPGVVLLSTVDIQGISIGTVTVDGPVNLYGGNVAFPTRNRIRLDTVGVEFYPQGGATIGTFFHDQTGCTTGCARANTAGVFYDSTNGGGGFQLSNNNDAASPIARAVTTSIASVFTNATNAFATVSTSMLPIGAYHCSWTPAATNSTTTEGVQFQLAAGTATISNSAFTLFSYNGGTISGLGTTHSTSALASNATSISTCSGTCGMTMTADITVTGAGSVLWQAAENSAHATGTLSVWAPSATVCNRL